MNKNICVFASRGINYRRGSASDLISSIVDKIVDSVASEVRNRFAEV
jgi:hypothetical protein